VERASIRLGRVGEDAALAWYLRRGYSLIARNWTCPLGELDLVLGRGSELVICEVKTRRGTALGPPSDAVDWRKRRKLAALAEVFLGSAGLRAQSVRFDVASVLAPGGPSSASVHVFEQAF
jgi:putative endonuclease